MFEVRSSHVDIIYTFIIGNKLDDLKEDFLQLVDVLRHNTYFNISNHFKRGNLVPLSFGSQKYDLLLINFFLLVVGRYLEH